MRNCNAPSFRFVFKCGHTSGDKLYCFIRRATSLVIGRTCVNDILTSGISFSLKI